MYDYNKIIQLGIDFDLEIMMTVRKENEIIIRARYNDDFTSDDECIIYVLNGDIQSFIIKTTDDNVVDNFVAFYKNFGDLPIVKMNAKTTDESS